MNQTVAVANPMIDGFGRTITYVRLSVTDRCDLRCRYCMGANNFCAGCNRIRVAATGTVYGCFGHDQKVELRELLRAGGAAAVNAALDELLAGKPERHRFRIAAALPAIARHMSVTGG